MIEPKQNWECWTKTGFQFRPRQPRLPFPPSSLRCTIRQANPPNRDRLGRIRGPSNNNSIRLNRHSQRKWHFWENFNFFDHSPPQSFSITNILPIIFDQAHISILLPLFIFFNVLSSFAFFPSILRHLDSNPRSLSC